jgi:hypothetical protein
MDKYDNLLLLFWENFVSKKITKDHDKKYIESYLIPTQLPKIKILPEDHPVADTYAGFLESDSVGEWITLKTKNENIHICQQKPIFIGLRIHSKGETLGDDLILPTFLHELAHVLTPLIRRKVDKEWINDYHGKEFYKNYAKILKWAEEKRFYKLTYQRPKYAKFSYHNLLHFDKIYLIGHKISTGIVLENWHLI